MQVYRNSSADEAFAAYRAGRSIPVTPELREWCARVRRRVSDGCAVQRVHVVTEDNRVYRLRARALRAERRGCEDVRIIRVAEGHPWPVDIPQQDFWLVDATELWVMAYAQDGAWLGAEHVHHLGEIVAASHARDAVLTQAQPWERDVRGA